MLLVFEYLIPLLLVFEELLSLSCGILNTSSLSLLLDFEELLSVSLAGF